MEPINIFYISFMDPGAFKNKFYTKFLGHEHLVTDLGGLGTNVLWDGEYYGLVIVTQLQRLFVDAIISKIGFLPYLICRLI